LPGPRRSARSSRSQGRGPESTGKPEQRAVNEPGPELEQPYKPIGHRPERRVAIGIAAAAKPGREQDEPEQRAAVTATGKPGAELEQRVAIAIADEPERRARELIEPEQHVPGGEQAESEQRVAIAAADEPQQHARELIQPEQHTSGEPAPFEPVQHAAANELEQRAAITIAAEPGSAPVGSGAVAAAATGCCTTALLTERLLRAVDDGVHRPSPPDTRPVGVWVAAPLVSPWSERMNAMWRSSL